MSVFRRGGKDKDKDKKPRRNFTSPDPAVAIVTSPSGKGGFQPLTSLNPPEFIPGEPESSPCSHHSVSDASALTRKSGRLLESEREMELEEVTDGATGGASGGDKEEKRVRMWHRPSVVKKLYPKGKDKKRPVSTFSGGDSQHVPEDALWVEGASDWPSETVLEEQRAEIERLQTELQLLAYENETLERKKNGDIKEVEGRY